MAKFLMWAVKESKDDVFGGYRKGRRGKISVDYTVLFSFPYPIAIWIWLMLFIATNDREKKSPVWIYCWSHERIVK